MTTIRANSRRVTQPSLRGPGGDPDALAAAEDLTSAAKDFRSVLAEELAEDLTPFLDERGKPDEAFRGVTRRIQDQHERRLRRAEREFLDGALLALSACSAGRGAVGRRARHRPGRQPGPDGEIAARR